MTDMIIIAAVVILAAFALRSVIKRKGRCSCGCDGCRHSCGKKQDK